jgi:hypothetical protein
LKTDHRSEVEQKITVSLTFRVTDRELLESRAKSAVDAHGGGVSLDGTLEMCVVEALLHSNPGVESYTRYGLELLS